MGMRGGRAGRVTRGRLLGRGDRGVLMRGVRLHGMMDAGAFLPGIERVGHGPALMGGIVTSSGTRMMTTGGRLGGQPTWAVSVTSVVPVLLVVGVLRHRLGTMRRRWTRALSSTRLLGPRGNGNTIAWMVETQMMSPIRKVQHPWCLRLRLRPRRYSGKFRALTLLPSAPLPARAIWSGSVVCSVGLPVKVDSCQRM